MLSRLGAVWMGGVVEVFIARLREDGGETKPELALEHKVPGSVFPADQPDVKM